VQIIATYNSVQVSQFLTILPQVVPPTGGQRVLRSTDLVYLGAYRCPAQGVYMDFSYGPMTGRVVAGATRLIMSGNITRNDPVYEFSLPAQPPHPSPSQAPRMTLFQDWGDVYHGKRVTWDTQGTQQPVQAMYPGGMHWSEAKQLLYWTYWNSYNTSGFDDWSLGASVLTVGGASTAYGPWRVAGGGKKGPWHCTKVAESPTGAMLTGATLAAGNANSTWGPELWDGTLPTAATPSGFGNPDLPLTKNLTYYPMFGAVNADGTYNGPLKSCRRPGDYFFEPFTSNYTQTEIDPTKNGGVGSWTSLDSWADMTWINLPDKVGVLYTGKIASGHVWYSNVGVGHLNCFHGFPPPLQITGPVSTDAYPAMWIYDPADLAAVRAGSLTDYLVSPTEVVNVQAQYGCVTAPINFIGSAKLVGGQFFEPQSRRLYVCSPEADATIPGIYFPLVHVFQVT
jgi:hypothetical protein